MGSGASKLNIADAVQKLRDNQLPLNEADLNSFWDQFWTDTQLLDPHALTSQMTSADLRKLRNKTPQHLVQLIVRSGRQLVSSSRQATCNTPAQQNVVLNCCRLLVRLLPFAYEDEDLGPILWATGSISDTLSDPSNRSQSDTPLAVQMLDAICDLLFCPDFTVSPGPLSLRKLGKSSGSRSVEPDTPPPELSEIDSCEYIWRSGVGFSHPDDVNKSGLVSSGFFSLIDHSSATQAQFDSNRVDLLRLLLVMCSESMYEEPAEASRRVGACVRHLTSTKNRHCLALFTSLLNTVLGFEPTGNGYFSFISGSSSSSNQSSATTSGLSVAEMLIETSLQVLIVCLDQQQDDQSSPITSSLPRFSQINAKSFATTETGANTRCESPSPSHSESIDSNENVRNSHCANQICSSTSNLSQTCGFNADSSGPASPASIQSVSGQSSEFKQAKSIDSIVDSINCNLFVTYLARIHRDDDLQFILDGFVRLLGQPLASTYLPSAARRLQAHQELLILFWRFCDLNKKFLYHALKSSQVLDVLVPILWHLNESKSDPARLGLVHIGVFIILLLSGERNFGVRLNKPFRGCSIAFRQLPIFSGSHADLLVVVFHRLATAGSAKLQPLFECLLTILVNVSPYLKSLSMVSAHKLLHLFEAFCTPWFLYCNESNHHLVFYLLEIFNNIVQYQFDGNANLVYTLIRKRHCFHQLANLPSDGHFINQSLVSRNSSESELANNVTPKKPSTSQSAMNITSKSVKQTRDLLCDEPNAQNNDVHDEQSHSVTPETEKNPQKSLIASKSMNSIDQKWRPSSEWVASWKHKLPLQTIMRMLQVLVPQVEKMCLDKGITDENEILKFLEHGTLVGLLPVPHPILIRKYQTNSGTSLWFRTYMWGVIYLRNIYPPIWYDTDVRLFEIQKL